MVRKYSDYETYIFYTACNGIVNEICREFPIMQYDDSGVLRDISREMVYDVMFGDK